MRSIDMPLPSGEIARRVVVYDYMYRLGTCTGRENRVSFHLNDLLLLRSNALFLPGLNGGVFRRIR